MLDNNIKLSNATVNHRMWSYLIDLGLILVCGVALFFASFYGVFVPTSNYKVNETLVAETLHENKMDLADSVEYQEYEASIKKFYFETYKDEIINNYFKKTGENRTIEFLYNIEILGLPKEPTIDTYDDNHYFIYKTSGTTILVNEVAETKKSGGPTFDRNIRIIFKNGYDSLEGYLEKFNPAYKQAKWENIHTKGYARLTATVISVLIFAFIIPLCNKKRMSIGDMLMKMAVVNLSNGYYASWWKIALRPLILFALPIVGMYFGSLYSVTILVVGPLFVNMLVMILSKNNLDITQKIFNIDQVYIKESLLFANEKEELSYIESSEYKEIIDHDYLTKLSESKPIDISESRSDSLKK